MGGAFHLSLEKRQEHMSLHRLDNATTPSLLLSSFSLLHLSHPDDPAGLARRFHGLRRCQVHTQSVLFAWRNFPARHDEPLPQLRFGFLLFHFTSRTWMNLLLPQTKHAGAASGAEFLGL